MHIDQTTHNEIKAQKSHPVKAQDNVNRQFTLDKKKCKLLAKKIRF